MITEEQNILLGKIEKLAKLERLLQVPYNERFTVWFGDYNMYEMKPGKTKEDIENRLFEMEDKLADHMISVFYDKENAYDIALSKEANNHIDKYSQAVDEIITQPIEKEMVLEEIF